VVYRSVTLGRQVDGERRIIQEGLKEGERIVVNGFARIRPGIKVKATTAPPDSATTAPADSGSAASGSAP
jgi:membrane fusion protein (multidrug efflux system)